MLTWAKKELELLNTDGDSMQEQMNDCLIEVLEVISRQGHSGFSIEYFRTVLNLLLQNKPATPLTGKEEEWRDIYNILNGETLQQNKRCYAVFRKNKNNSTAYYTRGKAFSNDNGVTWFYTSESRVPIKFPCMVPETEYVLL